MNGHSLIDRPTELTMNVDCTPTWVFSMSNGFENPVVCPAASTAAAAQLEATAAVPVPRVRIEHERFSKFLLIADGTCSIRRWSFNGRIASTSPSAVVTMAPWQKKTTDSRTYINLIHNRASRFANWEPSYPIELGDYGAVDKETGEFIKDGNVFKELQSTESIKLTPREGEEDEKYTIFSLGVSEVTSNNVLAANFPGVAEASIKAQFKFGIRFGAVLLMHKPVTSKLEGIDHLLQLESYDFLRSKVLVTEVVKCPSYAMYLSGKTSETVALVLSTKAPAAEVVGADVSGGIGGSWHHEGASGVFRCGSKASRTFTTLYRTVAIGKRHVYKRELEIPDASIQDKDCWLDTVLPWNTLNENGEESEHAVVTTLDLDDW